MPGVWNLGATRGVWLESEASRRDCSRCRRLRVGVGDDGRRNPRAGPNRSLQPGHRPPEVSVPFRRLPASAQYVLGASRLSPPGRPRRWQMAVLAQDGAGRPGRRARRDRHCPSSVAKPCRDHLGQRRHSCELVAVRELCRSRERGSRLGRRLLPAREKRLRPARVPRRRPSSDGPLRRRPPLLTGWPLRRRRQSPSRQERVSSNGASERQT